MATLRYYLDNRNKNDKRNTYPLRLGISHKSSSTYISTPIRLTEKQWDKTNEKIINHPQAKQLNNILMMQKSFYLKKLMTLEFDFNLHHYSVTDLKYLLIDKPNKNNSLFMDVFNDYTNKINAENTLRTYKAMLSKLKNFHPQLDSLKCNDIDKKFVEEFKNFLNHKLSANSVWNFMSKFKTIILHACKNDLCTKNPFINVKIVKQQTRKRNLNIETLREILNLTSENKFEQFALDVFKISFCLIGINLVDLFGKSLTVKDGRVEYYRAKTGKLYSVKIPEQIKTLLPNTLKNNKNTIAYYTRLINYHLKVVTKRKDISLYWARHTWATIAAELEIPKETIANALGHSQNSTTDVYIEFNQKKVDDANKKVLEYVFGKEE